MRNQTNTRHKALAVPMNSLWRPLNWPISAEFGLEYVQQNLATGEVLPGKTLYFDDERALDHWLAGFLHDPDFSVRYTLYRWDLGPHFVREGWL